MREILGFFCSFGKLNFAENRSQLTHAIRASRHRPLTRYDGVKTLLEVSTIRLTRLPASGTISFLVIELREMAGKSPEKGEMDSRYCDPAQMRWNNLTSGWRIDSVSKTRISYSDDQENSN
jgi:hypothetical protein